jgi:hypothetical protein
MSRLTAVVSLCGGLETGHRFRPARSRWFWTRFDHAKVAGKAARGRDTIKLQMEGTNEK